MTTILIVDDDQAIRALLTDILTTNGYTVLTAANGKEALHHVGQIQPHLILLDLMLPDIDGLLLINTLRLLTSTPIIVLSARQEQGDRVLSLKMGADDFIGKPFDMDDLEARIAAVLRRTLRPATLISDQIKVADLFIWPSRSTASLGGHALALTPTEWRLMIELASHPDVVLSNQELGLAIFGYDEPHLIDVHLGRARQKLNAAVPGSDVIETVHGRGHVIYSRAN